MMNHENIVTYIGKSKPSNPQDSIARDNHLYIILEYVEKGSLDKLR